MHELLTLNKLPYVNKLSPVTIEAHQRSAHDRLAKKLSTASKMNIHVYKAAD